MAIRLKPFDLNDPRQDVLVTRRRLIKVGGVTLVATALYGCESTERQSARAATSSAGGPAARPMPQFPRVATTSTPENVGATAVTALDGSGMKPIYVARPGSTDPVEHSVADTLFWTDIMMEHARFFVMLMPGPELAGPRSQAEQFQARFADHLARVRGGAIDRGNYQGMNRATIDLVRPFADYKFALRDAQTSGRMRSLVWPTFFDHTGREAERFTRRLDQFNSGVTAYDRPEVVSFWARIMDEHALFIAHLLDPEEAELKRTAETASQIFREIRTRPAPAAGAADPVMAAVHTIIDFKTAAEQGIVAGQIKSIIHPTLADHVRREAVRFEDELKRAA